MDKADIRKIILGKDGLAERETALAGIYQEEINTRTWDSNSPAKKAQIALTLEKNRSLLFQEKRGLWGTTPRTTPVLLLLLHHPVLFVDFGGWSEPQFVEHYGITAVQMAKLAKAGFIIPSLYFYDSYKRNAENEDSYEEEKCHHLLPLYETDETHIRIASIRRRAMFKSLGISEDDEHSSVQKWEHLFAPMLEKVKGYPLVNLIGYGENDFLHKSCVNFEYINVLGVSDPQILSFCSQVKDRTKLTPDELIEQLRVINGLKTRLASPLTAAYGGTYNMSAANYRNLNLSAKVVPVAGPGTNALKAISDEEQEILKALAATKLMPEILAQDSSQFEFPIPPENDDDIDRYIDFLRKYEKLPQKISSIIANVRECKTRDDLLSNWVDYFHFIREIHTAVSNDMKWTPKFWPSAAPLISICAFILGFANPIVACTCSIVGAWTGHVLADKYIKFKTAEDPQWRLVTKLNDLDLFS